MHKHECKTFAKLPRVLPGSVRVAMRVLMQNAEDEVFTQCEDHVERFRAGAEGKRWEVVFVMGKGVHGYSGTKRGEEEVRRLYCAVCRILPVSFFLSPSDCVDDGGCNIIYHRYW